MSIAESFLRQRTARVRRAMKARGLDALVLFSYPVSVGYTSATLGNVRYLTDRTDHTLPLILVLPLATEPALVTAMSYHLQMQEQEPLWIKDVRVAPVVGPVDSYRNYGVAVRRILEERCGSRGRVGLVGAGEMPAAAYLALTAPPCLWEFEGADELIARERMIKGPEEIERMRTAAQICDAMQQTALESARTPGKTAFQLLVDMEYTGRTRLAEHARVALAAGPETGFPIHFASENNRALESGDRIITAVVAVFDGYWGHSNRLGFKGRPSAQFRKVFEILLEAQEAGIAKLRPGVPLAEVPQAMLEVTHKHLPGGEFARVGHGLGLDYSEPLVSDYFRHADFLRSGQTVREPDAGLLLEPGMVLELHPDLAAPSLGSRWAVLGDVWLVTATGGERLTQFPREIFEA